jgi:hypothetical protein
MSNATHDGLDTCEWFPVGFRRVANCLAAYYGGPVYLVGGALQPGKPRDLDIRIVISEPDALRLFGKHNLSVDHLADHCPTCWKQLQEQLRENRLWSQRWHQRFDIQFQTDTEAQRYAHEPRLRLDSAPEWFFDTASAADLVKYDGCAW